MRKSEDVAEPDTCSVRLRHRERHHHTTLKAGKYAIRVEDKSSLHNFHLFGPGVNKKTTVSGTATQTWTVTLKPGTYTYECDVHFAAGMKGSFIVTT